MNLSHYKYPKTDKFWENGGSLTEIKIVFVNGKIRLLRKVENPSVPFLNLLSYTWNTKQFPRRRCDRRISKLSEQRNLAHTKEVLFRTPRGFFLQDSSEPAIEISVTFYDTYGIRVETGW